MITENILNQIKRIITETENEKIKWKVSKNVIHSSISDEFYASFEKEINTVRYYLSIYSNGKYPSIDYSFNISKSNKHLLYIDTSKLPEFKKELEKLHGIALGAYKENPSKRIDDFLDNI